MDSALNLREIQSRTRGGATLTEVTTEARMDPARMEGFALPVLAEREHMTSTALGYVVRRRGDGLGHHRLQKLISTRLQARGIDSEDIVWDSQREPDRKWRLVGVLESHKRRAEFIFDPRGRFTIADSPDARWMIGEELPGSKDPDNENTVDLDDEFVLVRVTAQPTIPPSLPGDDVPIGSSDEGPATSGLDDLYDMLSGVSEDSVRTYVGIDDEPSGKETPQEQDGQEEFGETGVIDDFAGTPEIDAADTVEAPPVGPTQDSLVETDTGGTVPQPRLRHRRRIRVPSWDGILFSGPSSRRISHSPKGRGSSPRVARAQVAVIRCR